MEKKNIKKYFKIFINLEIKYTFWLVIILVSSFLIFKLFKLLIYLCSINHAIYTIVSIFILFIIHNLILSYYIYEGNKIDTYVICDFLLLFCISIFIFTMLPLQVNVNNDLIVKNNVIDEDIIKQVCYNNIPNSSRLHDNSTYPISFEYYYNLGQIGGFWCDFSGGTYNIGETFYLDFQYFLEEYNKIEKWKN